jgi:FtsP/CotA-like multicopper oxidase with cupredoxin domain
LFGKQSHKNRKDSSSSINPTISTIGNNTRVYHYHWIITESTICPDNYPQTGYLINGVGPPGPEIRVKKHSILLVTITNNLPRPDQGITFHFHGIHQRGSFLSDGVPTLTQVKCFKIFFLKTLS